MKKLNVIDSRTRRGSDYKLASNFQSAIIQTRLIMSKALRCESGTLFYP